MTKRGSGDESMDHTNQAALNYARDNGLTVIVPARNEVMIDIDSDASLAIFENNLPLVERRYTVLDKKIMPSRNKAEGKHIRLLFDRDITDHERIALQAVLGSDLRREAYSLLRIVDKQPLPTLFFEDLWTPQKNEIEKLKKEVSRLQSDVSRYQYPDTTGQ